MTLEKITMVKAYSIMTYRAIHDPAALAAYAKLAGPAVQAMVDGSWRAATQSRYMNVIVEFDSVEKVQAALESHAYQEALRALGNGAERDIRIVEGV